MEISQKDRDSLREAQQKRAQPSVIGNLVEHKIQNPAEYKALSRREQGLDVDKILNPSKAKYVSKYVGKTSGENSDWISVTSSESVDKATLSENHDSDRERDLPISLQDVQANLWLNMDRVEFDKLEWMSEKAEKIYSERLQSTTHFDSEGRAIPPEEFKDYVKQSNKNLDLQGRVHDLDSLIKFLDSKFQPQVTYALGVISKIALRASTGYYDGTFDNNIHELLINQCLLRVRHHIDNPNETLCQNALRCMRSLLCNTQIDEIFLDRMHPILSERFDDTLWLGDIAIEEKFEMDMDDNTCVKLDAILALVLRTDLLPRLEYLLKTKQGKFDNNYSDCILDILIRLARHSRGICLVLSDTSLLELVISKHLPVAIAQKSEFEKSLTIRALKLIRIITQASHELNDCQTGDGKFEMPNSIFSRLESYYYIDVQSLEKTGESSLFRVHIEALRIMKVMFKLDNLAKHIHSIVTMSQSRLIDNLKIIATKLKSAQIVESRISLDWQWAAHTIDLIGHLIFNEHRTQKSSATRPIWIHYIKPITNQWLVDLIREEFIPHLDISVTISTAVAHSLVILCDFDAQSILGSLMNFVNSVKEPKKNASLSYFNLLVREAERRSQLTDTLTRDGRLRDPSMLNSYGCLDFNSTSAYEFKLNPAVENDTPLVLLELFTDILHKQSIRPCKDQESYMSDYANNLNTVRYFRCASRYFKEPRTYEPYVRSSFLIQREVQIMMRLTLIQIDYYMQDHVEIVRLESYSNLILGAISTIGLFNPQTSELGRLKDKLMDSVILNEDLHRRLADDNYLSTRARDQFDLNYYNIFGLNHLGERQFKMFDADDIRVLQPIYRIAKQPGRFWIFQPLIEYYKSHQTEVSDSENLTNKKYFENAIYEYEALNIPMEDTEVVASMLRLHAAIVHNSPAYNHCVLRPNIEEFLCIISTIFLDDDLFLDPKVSSALNLNLELLIAECIDSKGVFKDASRTIESLDLPLHDLFSKLVDQYESCSYGDTVFTNFLLLFIAAKSDNLFKKKLFSEKVETCIRQMRLTPESVWAPSNLILEHIENDPEIKELIHRAGPYIYPGSFMSLYRRKQMLHFKN